MRGRTIRSKAAAVLMAAVSMAGGVVAAGSPMATSTATAASLPPGYRDTVILASSTSPKVTIFAGTLRKDLQLGTATRVLTGNFDGDRRSADAFLYSPGPAQDFLLTWTVSNGVILTGTELHEVGGSYRPFVIDYDENGVDDIFWYAPGTARDYVWTFAAGGEHETVPVTVHGDYQPIPVRSLFYGGDPNPPPGIIWYGAGDKPDAMWFRRVSFNGWSSLPLRINGDYRPITGTFAQTDQYDGGDILWYSATGPEYVWTFGTQPGTFRSDRLGDVAGGARPVVGDYRVREATPPAQELQAVLWYRPGAPRETYWVPRPDPTKPPAVDTFPAGSITGDYRPLAYGAKDVMFLGPGTTAAVVHFGPDGPTHTVHLSGLPTRAIAATSVVQVS